MEQTNPLGNIELQNLKSGSASKITFYFFMLQWQESISNISTSLELTNAFDGAYK